MHHRALQTVLRPRTANGEPWLAHQLSAYLQDPIEYRATTGNVLQLGGTVTYSASRHHRAPRPTHHPPHPWATPAPITCKITTHVRMSETLDAARWHTFILPLP
ncbi:MAG: hypothetical protein DLM62_16755 [Pseudonocardiales bacterium]|nr:MAG: hypothetical protein DLM62_16755 [Pseudonocardiales bacterium]